MKSIIAASLFLVSLVTAAGGQDPRNDQSAQLPLCAQTCVNNQMSNGGYANCNLDVPCICKSGHFLSSIACCLLQKCNTGDLNQTVTFAQNICNANGVQVPTEVKCDNPTSSGSPTSASAPATLSGAPSSGGKNPTSSAPKALAGVDFGVLGIVGVLFLGTVFL